MPYFPHDDRDLQKIAILPIPDALRMLEQLASLEERHRLADWLSRFWRGGVSDLPGARQCVEGSALDPQSKQILTRGLVD